MSATGELDARAATHGNTAEELLQGLNPAQREAVTHPAGPLLIVAGPGSGKTRVITRRIAWLARARGVDPRRCLAITFTNRAAREMRERVEALLPGAGGAWISTFHAFGARVLRREIEALPPFTRDFTIYDTSDRQTVLKHAIQEAGYDPVRFRPALVGSWISARKNQVEENQVDPAGDTAGDGEEDGELEVLRAVRRTYDAALERANALDFDDLLVKLLELFERHPGVRDAWAHRFEHLLVDEYQDTNRVQYRIVRHLARVHGNVAVCGDPDQSIYGWRGADLRNILEFERDFPGCRVVLLEQNYRSVNTILRGAQALIERNVARKEKRLWSELGDGAPIQVLAEDSEEAEARRIAELVIELKRDGVPGREIAVFYRANFLQRALETALRLARVPYQVVAGLEFYERREIRDLVAYAKLLVNPRDDAAFRRIVNVPARGIGDKSLEEVLRFATDRRISALEAARSSELRARIRGRARGGLEKFVELHAQLTGALGDSAGAALRAILAGIEREAWMAEMTTEQDPDREANVDELVAHGDAYDEGVVARRAQGEEVRGGLPGFLEEIALVSDVDALTEEADQVALMTLHAAKGLEFRAVFVAGCEEELLPHARSVQDDGIGGAAIEEERRLLYVGMTRARERLFLCHAHSRRWFGQWTMRMPSRFLAEIPRALIDEQSSVAEADALGTYEQPASIPELAVGDRVEHEHFGPGTVETLQGRGVNARATVRFPAYGTKQLLLQYANLRRVGRAR